MKDHKIDISSLTLIKFWLVIIGFALVIGLAWLARDVIIMLLIAFFLALVLNRPVTFLARKLPGKGRLLGTTITFAIVLIVLSGVVTLVLPVFVEQFIIFAKSLPGTIGALEEQSRSLLSLARDSGLEETVKSALGGLSSEANKIAASLGTMSVDAVTGFFSGIMNAFFVMVLTFFMLIEGPNWIDRFWKYAYRSHSRIRPYHQEVTIKMYDVISTFVTSQIIVAAINALLASIGMFVLAMTFGFTISLILPIASIVFISTFIPMFGPIIGGVLSGIIILLYDPIAAVIFVIYLILFQQVVYNILSPKIQGKRMNMSPLVVLIAMIMGLQIGGVFGALVAIPIAGCMVVAVRETIKYYSKSKPVKKTRATKS